MMRPEQFTMWLRGVLDTNGEGEAISASLSSRIYNQLSEVVGGQVADRLAQAEKMAWYPSPTLPYPDSRALGQKITTTDTISISK